MSKRKRRKLSRKIRVERNARRFKEGLEGVAWKSDRGGAKHGKRATTLAKVGRPLKAPMQRSTAVSVKDAHTIYSVGADLRLTARVGGGRGFTPGAI